MIVQIDFQVAFLVLNQSAIECLTAVYLAHLDLQDFANIGANMESGVRHRGRHRCACILMAIAKSSTWRRNWASAGRVP
jgi:hypothetical protein